MLTEELLLRGTAWLSLLLWAIAACLDARAWSERIHSGAGARLASTLGLLALLVHAALAFDIRYSWSHAAAARETARQAEALVGWSFSGAIWVNYLFLFVWTAEVARWWLSPAVFRRRPRGLRLSARAFFVLMFINGAIVFAQGPMRFLAAAAIFRVLWAWYRDGEAHARHV